MRIALAGLAIIAVLTAALLANGLLEINWAAYVALGAVFLLALLRFLGLLPGFGAGD